MHKKLIPYPDNPPPHKGELLALPLGILASAGLYNACKEQPAEQSAAPIAVTNPWSDPDFVRKEYKKLSDDNPHYFGREITADFVSKIDPALLNDADFILSLLSIDSRFYYESDNAKLVKALIESDVRNIRFFSDKLWDNKELVLFINSLGYVPKPNYTFNPQTNEKYLSCHWQLSTEFPDTYTPVIRGLSQNNPVHETFTIESDLRPADEIEEAKQILDDLLFTLTRRLAMEEVKESGKFTVSWKIQRAYQILQELGYTSEPTATLTETLRNKKFDCDTASLIILALAAELKSSDPEWSKVGAITLPGHVFLGYENYYYEYNGLSSKEYYLQQWSIPQSKADAVLKPLYGREAFQILTKMVVFYAVGNDNSNFTKNLLRKALGYSQQLQDALPYVYLLYVSQANIYKRLNKLDKNDQLIVDCYQKAQWCLGYSSKYNVNPQQIALELSD